MVSFTAEIRKFGDNKDKSGWTFVEIPATIAVQLHNTDRRAFRVSGLLDNHAIAHVGVMPMGDGVYMLTLNGPMRKAIGKRPGDLLHLQLEKDNRPPPLSSDLLACLEDEPAANNWFCSLSASHQRYFSNWVEEAKTQETKIKRLLKIIHALHRKMDYGAMIREKQQKSE